MDIKRSLLTSGYRHFYGYWNSATVNILLMLMTKKSWINHLSSSCIMQAAWKYEDYRSWRIPLKRSNLHFQCAPISRSERKSSVISEQIKENIFNLHLNKIPYQLRMTPLQTNRRILVWISAHSVPESENIWNRCAFVAFPLLLFIVNSVAIISSAFFIWKTLSTDFEASLYGLFQVCVYLVTMCTVMFAFFSQRRTTATIERLSEICNESKFH